jgi:outer membrane protein assembly factor BamB
MSSTGAEKWRFPTGDKFHHQQAVIADFNNDGEYEVAVHSNDRYVYMLSFFGTELWRFPVGQEYWDVNEDAGLHEGGLAAADVDMDGEIEVFTSDWIGNVHAINADGSQLWHYKMPGEVWSGLLIGDFTGDGQLDLIVEAESNDTYPEGLTAVLNGATGDPEYFYPYWFTAATPSAADFNNDGNVDIVVQAWSEPFHVLTANAPYMQQIITPEGVIDLWPWPYKYKTASNNAVVPMGKLEPPIPMLSLEAQWEYETDYGLHQACCSALQAYDVDHDGQMDIVIPFRKDSDRVMCVEGDDGAVKWIYPPMDQDGLSGGDPMGAPCIGDMDNDGMEEVLFTGRSSSEGNLYCVDAATGVEKWIWEGPGKDEAVCLYDVTGDGHKEAVFQGGGIITVVDHAGNLVWSYEMTSGSSMAPNAFDIDKDGQVEVLCGDGNGNLYCMSSTGAEKWRFPTGDKFHHQQPVIGDFNNDGEYEVAVHSNDRYLYLLTFFGTELWRFPIGQEHWDVNEDAGLHEGGVAAGDLDGDGKWEIITTDWIGHVYAITGEGNLKWHYKLPGEVWSGIVICDFTGDGELDVIVEGEGNESTPYPYGMTAVFSADGEVQYMWPYWVTAATPSVADFDNDGEIEGVFQAWSEPFLILGANGTYNPDLVPWGYKYKTASNNAVWPMPEGLTVLLGLGLLAFAIRSRKG